MLREWIGVRKILEIKISLKYEATFLIPIKYQKVADKLSEYICTELENNDIDVDDVETRNFPVGYPEDAKKDDKIGRTHYRVKTKTDCQPTCARGNKTVVGDKDEIKEVFYAGCYVNVIMSVYIYNEIAAGAGLNPKIIQFVGHGEGLGGTGVTAEDLEELPDVDSDDDDEDNDGKKNNRRAKKLINKSGPSRRPRKVTDEEDDLEDDSDDEDDEEEEEIPKKKTRKSRR